MTARSNPRQTGRRSEREAVARKLRAEGKVLREIAAEMGCAISTVDGYLNDPGGKRADARKRSYAGSCDTCGGPTNGSNGRDRAATRCLKCIAWPTEGLLDALREWGDDHGGIPPRTADARLGAEGHGRLPNETIVKSRFGSWNAGLLAAGYEALNQDKRPETTQAMADAIRRGVPTAEVGAMFGVSESAISVRLRYHGTSITELRRAA